MSRRSPSPSSKTVWNLVLAGSALAASLLFLWLLIHNVGLLARYELVGQMYFIVTVPLAIMVSAALFGVLRSSAKYSGRLANGRLEMGGAIVAFIAVIILANRFAPARDALTLVVFVHGERGPQDIVLRNNGTVLLDLGSDRRREAIDAKGAATFLGIPLSFQGRAIPASVDSVSHEANTDANVVVEGTAYLAVHAKHTELHGRVYSEGMVPVKQARVSFGTLSTETDSNGIFMLAMSAQEETGALLVEADGFAPWRGQAVPGGNEISVVLKGVQANP